MVWAPRIEWAEQGYPAHCFSPAQVAQIAAALQSPMLNRDLLARFDAEAMTEMGIYPGTWKTGDRDWLLDACHSLRDFYAAESKAGQSVVTVSNETRSQGSPPDQMRAS